MIVEKHTLDTDQDGAVQLRISGRSLTSFLESRVHFVVSGKSYKFNVNGNVSSGSYAAALIWNAIVNTTNQDKTRKNGTRSVYNAIPSTMVTKKVLFDFAWSAPGYWVVGGDVYSEVKKLIKKAKLGLRTLRPDYVVPFEYFGSYTEVTITGSNTSANPMTINSVQGDSGGTRLRFDLYETDNKSLTYTNAQGFDSYSAVVFSTAKGDLITPSSYKSIENYRNVALITSSGYLGRTAYQDSGRTAKGLQRREVYVDLGEPEEGTNVTEYQNSMAAIGGKQLTNYRRISMADGEPSPTFKKRYGEAGGYYLGDLVTLVNDYGASTDLVVNEYIRTEDAEGERGFPGLVLPSEIDDSE